jgi:WD40 repeat protein
MKNLFGGKNQKKSRSKTSNKSIFDSGHDEDDIEIIRTTNDDKKYYSNFSHKNLITDIIITKNYLFTSSMDKNICVWNKYTGNILKLFVGHQATVRCIKNIKEKTIISGGDDGNIKIWNVSDEQCIATIEYSKTDKITSLNLNVVDQILLFGTSNGNLLAMDWETRKFIPGFSTRKQHSKAINYIYNETDDCIYTGSMDGFLKSWDASDASLIEMKTFSQPIFKIASIKELFFLQHHTSITVTDSKDDWNCKSPFLSLCDFTITENNLLLGWNRVTAEMELWNISPRHLLHKEKIEGGMFIKKIKYDPETGIVYFAKNQTVSFIQLDIEKISESTKQECLTTVILFFFNFSQTM